MKKNEDQRDDKELSIDALRKKAFGYKAEEVVEEYGEVDGSFCLIKRKVTKKDVAPDLSALKAYMDFKGEDVYSKMSLSELEKEKQRLLKELAE